MNPMDPHQRFVQQQQQQARERAQKAHEQAHRQAQQLHERAHRQAQQLQQMHEGMVRRFDQPGRAGRAGGGGCIVVAIVVALMVLAFIGLLAFYVLFMANRG